KKKVSLFEPLLLSSCLSSGVCLVSIVQTTIKMNEAND
ncbi:MAG: hypothetical protein ACI9HY_002148, partial [Planctomycetaceae bacterium]